MMTTNNNSFQDTIKAYLDKRAQEDSLFAVTYAKENKNIKDCCSYITDRAKKMQSGGCAVISHEEVFGWAVHYYDEDDIKVEKSSNTRSEVKTSATKTEVKKPEVPKLKLKPAKKSDVGQYSLF
ncbi:MULTISPECIES: PcfK-like family protein [unclassified Dysgonomonas]|uniref:PcfK-like family protein n=1 Tax=unclassified Dysgonomonas TaxID=2630389 RepID=UPI0025C2EAA3|nr:MULTISPECIES: PcfK-like family protein [unclassified Dysgonomonas]